MEFFIFLNLFILPEIISGLTYDSKGFDDTQLYKIDWPGRLDILDQDKFEPMIVSTHHQEKYECMIPLNQNKEEDEKSIESGLSPLHFLITIFTSASCSYRIEAYWTYEICHGAYVKQYHEEREGKNIKIQEYYLGKWTKDKLDILSEQLKQDQDKRVKFKTTKIDNVRYPYIELEMSDGTICDINNEPRITRVRYVCYPHRKNEIYSIKETSTCNYEAVILTSVLCMHPSFKPEDSTESSINCIPVNDAPHKPLSWLQNEIDNLKIRYKQLTDVYKPKENIAIVKLESQDGTLRMDVINLDQEDYVENLEPLQVDRPLSPLTGENSVGTTDNSVPDGSNAVNSPKLLTTRASSTVKDTSPVKDFLEGKQCFDGGSGWWKFEFCYGRYVRQYHSDKSGKVSLILGYFDEKLHTKWLSNNPEKRPKNLSQRTEISHWYQGGSICDKTGEKRQTEVKLKCFANAPTPATLSMYLLEPKTCQYILVVESPLICDIIRLVDDDGLVSHDSLFKSNYQFSKEAKSVVIENVDGIEVRYEND